MKELAQKLQVDPMTVGHWENHNFTPSFSHIRRLKQHLPELTNLSTEMIYQSLSNAPITLGDKLKKKRLELGLSQIGMASKLGVSEDSIRAIEHNENKTDKGPVFKRIKEVILKGERAATF